MFKKLPLLLALLVSGHALADDKQIYNPDSNGNIFLKINKGGSTNTTGLEVNGTTGNVQVQALTNLAGNGAPIIGVAGGSSAFVFNGQVFRLNAPTNTAVFTEYDINSVFQASTGVAGQSNDLVTGSVAGDYNVRVTSGNINFSGNNGSTLHGQMTSAGAWTLGAPGSAITHTINGTNLTCVGTSSSACVLNSSTPRTYNTNGQTLAVWQPVNTAQAGGFTAMGNITWLTDNFSSGTATGSAIQFNTKALAGTVNQVGLVDSLGTWTLGISGGTQTHAMNGSLNVTKNISTTNGSVNASTNSSGGGADVYANNDTGANFGELLSWGSTRASNTFGSADANWIDFITEGASNQGLKIGTTTAVPVIFGANNANVGGYTSAGAWTLGSASYVADSWHTVRGTSGISLAPAGGSVGIGFNLNFDSTRNFNRANSAINGAAIGFDANSVVTNSAMTFYVQPSGSSGTSGTFVAGNVTGQGAWTLGPGSSSTSLVNTVNVQGPAGSGGVGPVFHIIDNYTGTATNADSNYGIQIDKPSTTTTSAQHFIRFVINGGSTLSGNISANGTNAAGFSAESDRRLKMGIVSINYGLSKLMSLRPVEFEYIKSPGIRQTGFIAQELEQVFPKDVATDKETTIKSIVGWSPQMAIMVQAIQELKHENDDLQTKYDALNARLEAAGL